MLVESLPKTQDLLCIFADARHRRGFLKDAPHETASVFNLHSMMTNDIEPLSSAHWPFINVLVKSIYSIFSLCFIELLVSSLLSYDRSLRRADANPSIDG